MVGIDDVRMSAFIPPSDGSIVGSGACAISQERGCGLTHPVNDAGDK